MTSLMHMIAAMTLMILIQGLVLTAHENIGENVCNMPASTCPFQVAKLPPRKLDLQGAVTCKRVC